MFSDYKPREQTGAQSVSQVLYVVLDLEVVLETIFFAKLFMYNHSGEVSLLFLAGP